MLKIKNDRATVFVGSRRYQIQIEADWGRPPMYSIVAIDREHMSSIPLSHDFNTFEEAQHVLASGFEAVQDPRSEGAEIVRALIRQRDAEEVAVACGFD